MNRVWGNSNASPGAVSVGMVSLLPLIPGGAVALSVSVCEVTLDWGFYDFGRDRIFFFSLFVSQCEVRMDKAVPGFEYSIGLSFLCDEGQVLVVRRDIHKA